LRTPISTLKVQLYNLQQNLRGGAALDELNATTERLAHIVEQILALYRSSPDQYNAALVPIDLAALAQQVMAEEYASFDQKQQSLEFHGEKSLILGDRFALRTLLQNLLANANKYTPAGGSIEVRLSHRLVQSPRGSSTRVTEAKQQVILSVEDSGPGIPAEQRAAVFERFYRVGGDRHQSDETGCGLGLAIVKRIVELHHAQISVRDSERLHGSAFEITFPDLSAESQKFESKSGVNPLQTSWTGP